jgi:hypothetical protein
MCSFLKKPLFDDKYCGGGDKQAAALKVAAQQFCSKIVRCKSICNTLKRLFNKIPARYKYDHAKSKKAPVFTSAFY